jgi:pantoate--beta-alanine ligase
VYPGGDPQVTVDPGPLGSVLEGRTRPGHYAGVLTVVAKLFGLVRPDVTVFGEKDYQQLALVRRMSGDLCLGVDVLGGETVREPDGLALSSRNRYLDPDQRRQAVALSRALRAAQDAGPQGYAAALAAAGRVLADADGVDLDYFVVRATDLAELDDDATGPARALVAARVGTTRLIDNLPLLLGRSDREAIPSNRERSEPGSTEPGRGAAKPLEAPPTSEAST